MLNKNIYVAGHQGMVGSAIVRRLQKEGNNTILTATRRELDLTRQQEVEDFFAAHIIDEIYLAAAKVGGIYANNAYPADFIYQNLTIESNIIHAAHKNDINRLLFLGSSCIYPRLAPQPMPENCLLTGQLEPTNEPYALAKIAGIKLCESYNRQYGRSYRSVMPTNLYGPQDNFHPKNSHVLPALLRRFHEAVKNKEKEVVVWGTGNAKREFLHVDDMAAACVFVMNLTVEQYSSVTEPMCSHLNIGTGTDCTIRETAEYIAEITGFNGTIHFDTSVPDGTPKKLLNVEKMTKLGWKAKISLQDGLKETYKWFIENETLVRK